MKSSRLSVFLVPLLAISFVISLFFVIYDSDLHLNKQRANLLLELQKLDGRLDREILLISSLQQQNYDPVTQATAEIRALKTQLIDRYAPFYGQLSPEVDLKLSAYATVIEAKITQAERVKTAAAIVRNGLNYLPQLIDDLHQIDHHNSDQVLTIANQLYRHYIFHSTLDADDISQVIEQLRSRNAYNEDQRFFIENLNLHIQGNLNAQQALSQLHEGYLLIPSAKTFSQLHQAYRFHRAQEIKQGEHYSILLLAICTLLLLWLGFLFRKLASSHQSAEKARLRLRDGVDSLNEAFALFDQTGHLVLFNEPFKQCYPWLKEDLKVGIFRQQLRDRIEPHIAQTVIAAHDNEDHRHNLQILTNGHCYLSNETPTAEGGEVWVRIDVTHSRHNQLELRKLSQALEQSPVSVVITDLNGNIEYINPKAEETSGYTKEEVIGANPRIFLSDYHSDSDYQHMWQALHAGEEWQGIFRNKHKNGTLYWESATISSLRNDANEITHYVAVKDDISAKKQAEDELRMNAAVFETTREGILITDAKSRIISVNPAFTRITGYPLEEVRGKTPNLLRSDRQTDEFYAAMWTSLNQHSQWSGEIWNKRKDQSVYPQWLSVSAIKNAQGKVQQYVAVFSDITQRKQQEHKIRQQANFDALTGLPNRTMLKGELQNTVFNASNNQHCCALLFVDLDRFKAVNDTMGHAVGDTLLQQVAKRLRHEIRDQDIIARFGGDEFVVILQTLHSTEHASATSQRLIDCLREPFDLQEREIYIGASIGISLYPEDSTNADTMLRHADMAMYKAKERGRNQYQFFNAEMRDQVRNRTELEQALRLALQNDEFELYYQPIINTRNGKVEAVESLVRWSHPERGIISPADFIPMAEETGLIQPLGLWVFEHACQQMQAWRELGLTELSVAINISSSQRHLGFNAAAAQALITKTGVNPNKLIIEITESMFLDGSEEAITWLNELKSLGVMLAIDDFGTGYSSLSYLKRFPIDKLKIDRAFVSDLPDDEDDASLVKAIIAMSHSMGLTLVAEGVENYEQLEYLKGLECDLIQGYLYSKPVPADQLPEVIRTLEGPAREHAAEAYNFII